MYICNNSLYKDFTFFPPFLLFNLIMVESVVYYSFQFQEVCMYNDQVRIYRQGHVEVTASLLCTGHAVIRDTWLGRFPPVITFVLTSS